MNSTPAIDREPAPVENWHLVPNGDVGVQIRIPASAVAVGERGGDQPGDVGLPNPVPSLPGEQCLAFDEAQRILHRGPVPPSIADAVRPMIEESMANMGRLLDQDY